MNKQTSKILGTALAIALAGGVLYGGIKLVQNWDTVKNNTKDFIQDVTSKKEIDDLKAQVADLKLKLETANADKATLTAEVTDLKVKLETANARVAELEANAETTAEELAQARADAEALQSQLTTKENELASAQVRIAELENQLSNQNTYRVETKEYDRYTFTGNFTFLQFENSNDYQFSNTFVNASDLKTSVINCLQIETFLEYKLYDSDGEYIDSCRSIIDHLMVSEDNLTIHYIDQDDNAIQLDELDDNFYEVQLIVNNIHNDAENNFYVEVTFKFI